MKLSWEQRFISFMSRISSMIRDRVKGTSRRILILWESNEVRVMGCDIMECNVIQ